MLFLLPSFTEQLPAIPQFSFPHWKILSYLQASCLPPNTTLTPRRLKKLEQSEVKKWHKSKRPVTLQDSHNRALQPGNQVHCTLPFQGHFLQLLPFIPHWTLPAGPEVLLLSRPTLPLTGHLYHFSTASLISLLLQHRILFRMSVLYSSPSSYWFSLVSYPCPLHLTIFPTCVDRFACCWLLDLLFDPEMDGVYSSKISINLYQTTQYHSLQTLLFSTTFAVLISVKCS
jgi:hypothetical protein